jgi:alpha-tubulin suppressor-like RCC1 family protein
MRRPVRRRPSRRGLRPGLLLGALAFGLVLSGCGSGSSSGDKVVAVATGYVHTCAVTAAGGAQCWGANGSGQLGNGTNADSSKPVDVIGLESGVVAIAAGGEHSCALTRAGAVKCWGLNSGGQLGNGTNLDSSRPVDVIGLTSGVTAIAAGAGWDCALTSAGGVRCWGWNAYGQLGNGLTQNSSTPVAVKGLASGVRAISANNLHGCALTIAGRVKCWGSISIGDVPAKTDSDVPVDVPGFGAGDKAVATGGLHACAITGAGGVRCWGTNGEGELGNGSRTDSAIPVAVSGLSKGVTGLAVGSTYDYLPTHICALTSAGGVMCWGPNGSGQLGNGARRDSSRPVPVSGLTSGVTAVAVGGSHTCAITQAQRVKCWGANSNGQLGNGTKTDSATPVDVAAS